MFERTHFLIETFTISNVRPKHLIPVRVQHDADGDTMNHMIRPPDSFGFQSSTKDCAIVTGHRHIEEHAARLFTSSRPMARMVLISFISLVVSGCGPSNPPARPKVVSAKKKTTAQKSGKSTKTKSVETPLDDQIEHPLTVSIPTDVQTIHRPSETRPTYDDQKLTALGFSKAISERLILYSDLKTDDLRGLPNLADQLYPELENYFGPLPPDLEGRPYQMTAFLMSDAQRFVDAGLLSAGRIQPHEGWYRGNEFWWNQQPSEYYTRHLLLHEATHCYMHVMPSVDCPPWYVEGMAEWFGTHQMDETGKLRIGVLPESPDNYLGWARISVIQEEVAAGRLQDIDQILKYTFNDFQKLPAYAWSWALCHYLNAHPRYQKPFHELAKRLMDGGFLNTASELFAPDLRDLKTEWLLFASELQYGHDIPRSVIDFEPGIELAHGTETPALGISSTRGWQSTRVNLIAGQSYQIQSSGRVTLAETSKPWISEPQGISIRYFSGQPLGRLMGFIRPSPPDDAPAPAGREILKLLPLGPDVKLVAPHSGTLYLRVSDAWNELQDNDGEYQVRIKSI